MLSQFYIYGAVLGQYMQCIPWEKYMDHGIPMTFMIIQMGP